MAKKPAKAPSKPKTSRKKKAPPKGRIAMARAFVGVWARRILRWGAYGVGVFFIALLLWVGAYRFINPPTTPYMLAEANREGGIDQEWVDIEEISPNFVRAVVAAEDANFCLHWGFDIAAIREALEDGADRGASTLTQQTVKNVFLWHGRSWFRKALEALMTPVVEAVWPKRRIVEIYMNVAEFDRGVFGAEAAARNSFRVGPDKISLSRAARLAAVLPNPKGRSAASPSAFVWQRADAIADGAETIRLDGRADCFSG